MHMFRMSSPVAIAIASSLALSAAPAGAHAFLKTATPAVGSTVSPAPAKVVIDFTEGVEPRFSTIVVQNAQGAQVESGKPYLDGGETHLAVALKPLPPGVYTVVWHATATDTHKTTGKFTFTVSAP
jgi:methionine-rich copper-binding protein CopC